MFPKSKGNYNVVYNGETITGKDTFLKRLVKPESNFILLCGALELKKWKRFKRIRT